MALIEIAIACIGGMTLEEIVDEDIDEFETFFKGLGNDSLAGGERAAIKTYLWFKTHPQDELTPKEDGIPEYGG